MDIEKILEKIADEAGVPVASPEEMYRDWRKIATDRIDIARKALKEIKIKPPIPTVLDIPHDMDPDMAIGLLDEIINQLNIEKSRWINKK